MISPSDDGNGADVNPRVDAGHNDAVVHIVDDDNGADVTREGHNGGGNGDHQAPAVDCTRPETRVTGWSRGSTRANSADCNNVTHCFMHYLLLPRLLVCYPGQM